MKFLKRHRYTCILVLIFILIVILGFKVKEILVPDEGKATYGERLKDINKHPISEDEYKKIDEAYERLGGEEKFGAKVGSYGINNKTNIYWQQYEKGYIVGNNQYGYHESSGNIREVWRSFGFEGGKLGFPIGNIETNTNTGIYWQQYQNGYIVGNDKYR